MDMCRYTKTSVERTNRETKPYQNNIKFKVNNKITQKYEEIDLFGKRPSEQENSIEKLKQ